MNDTPQSFRVSKDGKVYINGTELEQVQSFLVAEDASSENYIPGQCRVTVVFDCDIVDIKRKNGDLGE